VRSTGVPTDEQLLSDSLPWIEILPAVKILTVIINPYVTTTAAVLDPSAFQFLSRRRRRPARVMAKSCLTGIASKRRSNMISRRRMCGLVLACSDMFFGIDTT